MTSRSISDYLIAPDATRAERVLGYGAATLGAAGAAALAVHAELSALAVAVIAVIAFDLFGGSVVNATASAKRHFHRPGRTARHHLGFVAIHVQPFLLALVVPDFAWYSAAFVYLLALGGALAVLAAPAESRRPLGFAWVTLALLIPLDIPAVLLWLTPVLLIKLLLAHLQPDEVRGTVAPSAR
ncbi:Uncharacterised protein [Nocardia otitidiscaviarum]|uniref:Uncharacterized protein n=1 Tax=Nocardia otitidiscaviarum TaxID=1823 RepID=A0A378YDG3_9NOCA|nr:hypothetical protein [Nocardia otitidiscaviarum]SUA74541.1 Uncharacterised protein [Nocardia otitidiscaviarum]